MHPAILSGRRPPPPVAALIGLPRDRRSGVALLFAILALPMTALAGLAIDYAIWNQTNSAMALAASGAALNAVKIAATAKAANSPNSQAEGVTAGTQWFSAQINAYAGHLDTVVPVVTVVPDTTITATVTYSGHMTSIFGNLFNVISYPVSVSTAAVIETAPFLNIEILLDNSPSMEIGATANDIATLQLLTACSTTGALYNADATGQATYNSPSIPSGQPYSVYQCSAWNWQTYTYSGPGCPITVTTPPYSAKSPLTYTPTSNGAQGGPTCQNLPVQASTGRRPVAGAPCAFACHFDTSAPAGTGNDYFSVARSTLNTSNPVTLRFDLVKAATNTIISTMQTDDQPTSHLGVGVFTFTESVTRVYPPVGEAGNAWATAIAAVGSAPTSPNTPDSGIQPYAGGNGADTDFPTVMTSLASTYLTASGDGITATYPQKVLFIVTDGVQDGSPNGNRTLGAFDPSYCTIFKNMGYSIYVVYTPYTPLMNGFYLQNMMSFAEATGPTSISYNLQACASTPAGYISASDGPSLTAALQSFLKQALTSQARLTK